MAKARQGRVLFMLTSLPIGRAAQKYGGLCTGEKHAAFAKSLVADYASFGVTGSTA